MSLVRVLGKSRVREMSRDELDALRAKGARTVVDVGTGDGRFVYALASEHPDWTVIGIDALDEPMAETASRALRKPERGGRPNVLLARASAETLPDELRGVADEVVVMLPWGRLLEGIVLGDADVVRGLASLLSSRGRVAITLNGEMWGQSTPVKYDQLPRATPDYVRDVVAPTFASVGVFLETARWLDADEAHAIRSTWARRLAHGREHPRFLYFGGEADDRVR